jgi:hypothetical protein
MQSVQKANNFKADEAEKAELTSVREHFEVESNEEIKRFLNRFIEILGCGPATCSFFN